MSNCLIIQAIGGVVTVLRFKPRAGYSVCHRCGISSKGAVLPANTMIRRWAPPTRYTLWRSVANITKHLMWCFKLQPLLRWVHYKCKTKPFFAEISAVSSILSRTTSPLSMSAPSNQDPLTCPIIPGRETIIEINKGKAGLGVSIVGGSDSLLVSNFFCFGVFQLRLAFYSWSMGSTVLQQRPMFSDVDHNLYVDEAV